MDAGGNGPPAPFGDLAGSDVSEPQVVSSTGYSFAAPRNLRCALARWLELLSPTAQLDNLTHVLQCTGDRQQLRELRLGATRRTAASLIVELPSVYLSLFVSGFLIN